MRTDDGKTLKGHPRAKREEGIALVMAVLILVLVAGVAIAAMSHSREELKAGGRSRSVMRSLFAAEAGIQFAEHRLLPPRDLTAFSFALDGISVESRARDQGTPQAIASAGLGKPPAGYSINIGAGFVNEVFSVNATASNAVLPTTEIEVRLGLLAANAGEY